MAAINPTGRTQVRFQFAVHDNGDSADNRIVFASGDNLTQTIRPALDVTYLPPGATTTTTTTPVTTTTSPGECTRAPPGTLCTDDGNPCTMDVCDATGACSHPPGNSGTVCRAAAGPCDIAELCNGSSPTCPTDFFAPVSTECRPATGACDVAETCTGTSASCPMDRFMAPGTVCRASAGSCDVAETCTGTAAACPTNGFMANGTSCFDPGTCTTGTCQTGTCMGSGCPPPMSCVGGACQ